MTGEILIKAVKGRQGLGEFVAMPHRIYADDPNYVRPLDFERLELLNPKKNPYFEHAEAQLWIAYRDGRAVGRISAQVDQNHLARYHDSCGHFGFLEAENDPAVFESLMTTAEGWLRQRGMKLARGPFSFSINEESGCLVKGFDSPPMILMGHARPYYDDRIKEQGYEKAKDLIAFKFDMQRPIPEASRRLIDKAIRENRIRLRPLNRRRLHEDLRLVVDIFNDAWQDNWGFVPMTESEVSHMAKSLKPIVDDESICIAEVDGTPAAMVVVIPNLNEAIADFEGKLLPFNLFKLIWRLKVSGVKSVRMPLMGVRKAFRKGGMGAALAFGVIETVRNYHREKGTELAELSWILEDNRPTIRLINSMETVAYKTYRIFEKAL